MSVNMFLTLDVYH